MQRRRAFLSAVLGAALATASLAQGRALAQGATYPNQPIRMVVPFAPGGASDSPARLLQPGMSQHLGQQIVVDNRAGAAGNVGMDVAARAAPDGYTLYLGNVGTISINPTLFGKELTVKPDKDFAPVTLVAETRDHLIAHQPRQGRAAEGARRDHQGAGAVVAGCADHDRVRLSRQRQHLVAG